MTVLPLRCLRTLWQLLTSASRKNTGGSSSSRMLPGAQLYDLLCVLLLLAAVGMLSQIKPGVIYYWMKDITSEFLKIQVVFSALEILDKVSSGYPLCKGAVPQTLTLLYNRSCSERNGISRRRGT